MQPKSNVAETEGVRIFGWHGVLAGTKEEEECKPHHIGGGESGFVRGRLRGGESLVQDWERERLYSSGGRVGFCITFELSEQTGVDGMTVGSESGVCMTQEGERLRHEVEGVRHCARSDTVFAGRKPAIANSCSEDLEPRD
jgi:hypothetical protein